MTNFAGFSNSGFILGHGVLPPLRDVLVLRLGDVLEPAFLFRDHSRSSFLFRARVRLEIRKRREKEEMSYLLARRFSRHMHFSDRLIGAPVSSPKVRIRRVGRCSRPVFGVHCAEHEGPSLNLG